MISVCYSGWVTKLVLVYLKYLLNPAAKQWHTQCSQQRVFIYKCLQNVTCTHYVVLYFYSIILAFLRDNSCLLDYIKLEVKEQNIKVACQSIIQLLLLSMPLIISLQLSLLYSQADSSLLLMPFISIFPMRSLRDVPKYYHAWNFLLGCWQLIVYSHTTETCCL